jgi:hypothetical protein
MPVVSHAVACAKAIPAASIMKLINDNSADVRYSMAENSLKRKRGRNSANKTHSTQLGI